MPCKALQDFDPSLNSNILLALRWKERLATIRRVCYSASTHRPIRFSGPKMKILEQHSSDDPWFRPRALAVLADPAIEEIVRKHNVSHPLPAANAAWSAFRDAFFDVLMILKSYPDHENNALTMKFEASVKAWLYRAAEFSETMGKSADVIGKTQTRKFKFTLGRSVRRELSELCNLQKHEDARLVSGSMKITGLGHEVPLFSLYQPDAKRWLRPINHLHEDRPFFSLNVELRRKFAFAYFAGDEVAKSLLQFIRPAAPFSVPDGLTLTLVRQLLTLPNFVTPGETTNEMPLISVTDQTLRIQSKGGPVTTSLRSTLVLNSQADGYSVNYAQPKLKGLLLKNAWLRHFNMEQQTWSDTITPNSVMSDKGPGWDMRIRNRVTN
jgi:hypothetical protein